MTVAILLVVCLVLAGAVIALVVVLRKVEARLAALETQPHPMVSLAAQQPPREQADDVPATGTEFVITRLGSEPADEPAPVLETRLFADVVLREAVIKAASLAYGVRRGLSPANRNRIWFEMRREVKRARKDRKAEEREAIREWRARKRAGIHLGQQEESAA